MWSGEKGTWGGAKPAPLAKKKVTRQEGGQGSTGGAEKRGRVWGTCGRNYGPATEKGEKEVTQKRKG